jgi:flagellar FliL protein
VAEATANREVAPSGGTLPNETRPKVDFLGLVIFGLVTVNLITLGGMGFFLQKMWVRVQELKLQLDRVSAAPTGDEGPLGKEMQPQNLGTLYPLESFLVNIGSEQGPKFLQTQMELELSEPGVEDEISRKKAAIRDGVIMLLTSRSYRELREPDGMKKLRQDLLKSINGLLSSGKVKEIYFTQFHFN